MENRPCSVVYIGLFSSIRWVEGEREVEEGRRDGEGEVEG